MAAGPYGSNPGSTDWQTAFPVIARNLHIHYGEQAVPVLREIYPALQAFMDGYLERLVRSTPAGATSGLLLTGARGDWVPPEGNNGGPRVNGGIINTPTESISAFWHTLCVGYMAEIARAIGKSADAARYSLRLKANRAAYHTRFFNNLDKPGARGRGKRCCYDKGSQTSNVMALHLGAVPAGIVNATVGMLVASILDRNASSLGDNSTSVAPPEEDSGVKTAFDPSLPPYWQQGAEYQHTPVFGPGPHLDVGIL
eukprot:COSAG01_NODE_4901_length_4641_cov_17.028181_1_plen_255_part_00